VLIEETFPLKSGPQDFADFIQQSKDIASGWIGFYWGRTPEEYRASKEFGDQLMLGWLEFFQQHRPTN
jgi:hypothetical protein